MYFCPNKDNIVFSENMIRYEDIDTIGIASNDQYGQTYIKTIKINS